ncbi:hypothetical protein LTR53_001334 [Teratosphaeriaceae sp. CCFEE 6253]|nr:hypothetical protein LTR53_001334 [Teratosphaeriaceae sp. CCFEE 6253]
MVAMDHDATRAGSDSTAALRLERELPGEHQHRPAVRDLASIGGSLCDSIRQNYITQANYHFDAEVATTQFLPLFSAGYLGGPVNATGGDFNVTWTWPTASTLGVPSCTLGYGRRDSPITATGNGTTTTAPRTTAAGPVTVEALGTTFTSPTLYISYASVYAANGCSAIGTTISNTIVAILTNSPLSSVYGGTIPCDAHFRYTQEWTATAPFTVADLNEPVPYSSYSSQPWCATFLREQGCMGVCPTTLGYKPMLVVPEAVLQEMEPAWATCYGDIRGVYDPPIALTATDVAAGPTAPGVTTTSQTQTQSATPGSGLGPSMPSATAGPTTTPAPTVQPYDLGSTSSALPADSSDDGQTTTEPADLTTTADIADTSTESADPTTLGGAETAPANDPVATPTSHDPIATSTPTSGPNTVDDDGQSAQDPGAIATTTLDAAAVLASALSSAEASGTPASGVEDPGETAGGGSGVAASILSTAASPAAEPSQEVGTQQSIATVGSQTVVILPSASISTVLVVAQGDSSVTLTAGASATSLGEQGVGAGRSGVSDITGTASEALTVAALTPSAHPTAVTVGSETYSIVSQDPDSGSRSVLVIANGISTATLSAGNAATTLVGQLVSAASTGGGVVIGSGSDAATIAVSTQQTGTLGTGRGSTVDGETRSAGLSGAIVMASGIPGMTSSGEHGSGPRGSTTVESSAGGTTIAASQPTSTSMGTSTGSMSEKLTMSLGAVLAVCMFGVIVL